MRLLVEILTQHIQVELIAIQFEEEAIRYWKTSTVPYADVKTVEASNHED